MQKLCILHIKNFTEVIELTSLLDSIPLLTMDLAYVEKPDPVLNEKKELVPDIGWMLSPRFILDIGVIANNWKIAILN